MTKYNQYIHVSYFLTFSILHFMNEHFQFRVWVAYYSIICHMTVDSETIRKSASVMNARFV